ncbi:leucyl aminopeptidase [Sphingomonas sp. ID0503]|uniref:leucyl aminopeptidase n=1 Tax=Sphingomonas sp. ID0503 TaxID=3399691 RepID=UPI003AFABCA8
MQISFSAARPEGSYALAIPVRGPLSGDLATPLVRAAAAAQRFEGEAGGVAEVYVPEGEGARRLILLGVGSDASAAHWEKLGASAIARVLTSGETRLVIDAGGADAEAVAAIAHGASLRAWRHDLYRTKLPEKSKPSVREVVIVGDAGEGWGKAEALAKGVFFARSLVTEPANVIYPESFVDRARQAFEGTGVKIEVLDDPAMEALGMGALLGVARGSARPGRLLVMRWDGTDGAGGAPVALVGKGVTFDTGGISIKPAAGMEDMKWDMGGAAAVAGAMLAIAGRKAKAHVVGVCGLVENMPSGRAQRPGDVVTSMSGQTIEVINTDAEGRLVLCDAMTWVQRKYQPKTLVDLATLTGAMIISLANEYGGIFSNSDDLAGKLTAAGTAVGEPLWRFPLGEAYDKMIDSPIADMKNVGPRGGGSITAAQFLKRFVEEGVDWAHLDIAGMVWAAKAGPLWDKGATGYGVRLLDRFIADNFEG